MSKKATEKLDNDVQMKVVEDLAKKYYEANLDKNAAAKIERKSQAALEAELVNHGEPVVVKINDHMFLEIGYQDGEKEEIDPKKFMELYPDHFWELVSIPKTVVVKNFGEMAAAKTARIVKTRDFKINKNTTDPRK